MSQHQCSTSQLQRPTSSPGSLTVGQVKHVGSQMPCKHLNWCRSSIQSLEAVSGCCGGWICGSNHSSILANSWVEWNCNQISFQLQVQMRAINRCCTLRSQPAWLPGIGFHGVPQQHGSAQLNQLSLGFPTCDMRPHSQDTEIASMKHCV